MMSATRVGQRPPENSSFFLEPDLREPAFGLASSREIRLRDWPPASAKKFLSHAIARDPLNLLQHAQRIQLAIATADEDEAFSALLDLNIALGRHGKTLRDQMRHAAQTLLSPEQQAFLRRVQRVGCSATGRHPAAPYSVLSRGLTGKLDLVSRVETAAVQTSDPLNEADTQLRDGNVAAARTTLETALEDTPERDDIAAALLELYLRSQDLASLRSMRRRIGTPLESRDDWTIAEERLARACEPRVE